jgi:hypothetical protein
MSAVQEIHLELLLGRSVLSPSGQSVGRIEEIVGEPVEDACLVQEFHIGAYAALERFAGWSIGRAILDLFGAWTRHHGYRVPWDKLDLSDSTRPRLRCPEGELQPLRD